MAGKTYNPNKQQYENSDDGWDHYNEEEVRHRAEQEAQMQYEDLVNSPHYHALESLNVLLEFGYWLFAGIIAFGVPLMAYQHNREWWVAITLVIYFITLPFTGPVIAYQPMPSVRAVWYSLDTVWQHRGLRLSILGVFNVGIMFFIGGNTIIPLWLLLLMTGLCLAAGLGWALWHKLPKLQRIALPFVALGCLNLALLLNFVFSRNHVEEHYRFVCHYTYDEDGDEVETSYLYLEENHYDYCPQIRFFFDYEQLAGKSTIVYSVADGLLGIKVLKGYAFE